MLLNALLLSLIYLVSRTDMINGYMMLTKPIVLGPLVGLVLGDLQAGILIGATLELAFIGVMNIGISVSMDVSIATIVGGGLAILSGQDAAFALTIAIPTGIPVSYTHLRAHETGRNLVCRLLLEKKKKKNSKKKKKK